MRLDVKFRLSVYFTLVMASACLGHAEEAFLPGVLIFVTAMGLLFALAFAVEGRWSLTTLAANLLGLAIAAGAGIWIFSQLLRPPEALVPVMPWQAMLLPYIGPVLICILLAKLFRPKQINDFWLLHTVGLMEVILACVLASEPLFGLLLFGYLVCALWSLSLFHAYRERLRSGEGFVARSSSRPQAFLRAALWSIVIALIVVPLFLATPKLGESAWSPFMLNRVGPAEVGFNDGMDLNRTGRLRRSDEVAFEVEARDAGDGPKTDLDLEQRWRGAVLDHYEHGRWMNRILPPLLNSRRNEESVRYPRQLFPLPQHGDYTLSFAVPGERAEHAIGLFLADPVSLPDKRSATGIRLAPIASLQPEGRRSWTFEPAEQVLVPVVLQRTPYRYTQLVTPAKEPGLSPPIGEAPPAQDHYLQQPIPGVRRYARELLERLEQDGKLRTGDFSLVGEDIRVPPEQWERVAGLLTEYLAVSGDFTYSLQLTRRDLTLDPNEDFLRNLKRGHCERFASALALLARSCGIPSRIVVGFHGAEPGETDGWYLVRQKDAHGWVEIPVPRPGSDGVRRWHWRTFDPTPSQDTATAESAVTLDGWLAWQQFGGLLWRNFVIDYNADKRSEAADKLARWFSARAKADSEHEASILPTREVLGVSLVVLIAAILVFRRRRARAHAEQGSTAAAFGFPLYARLLALLNERLKMVPRPSQTPLEFALQAGAALRIRDGAAAVADVPLHVVEALYRSRFGNRHPSDAEALELERQVTEVAAALEPRPTKCNATVDEPPASPSNGG